MYRQPLCSKGSATWSQPHCENERQQSVNDFGCCILYNPRAMLRLIPIMKVLAAFIGNTVYVDVASPENERQQSVNTASTERQQSINRVSTERQQSWVLHRIQSKGYAMAFTHNRRIGSLYVQKKQHHGHSPSLKMSVNRASTERPQSINRASTILDVASSSIQGLCYGIYP